MNKYAIEMILLGFFVIFIDIVIFKLITKPKSQRKEFRELPEQLRASIKPHIMELKGEHQVVGLSLLDKVVERITNDLTNDIIFSDEDKAMLEDYLNGRLADSMNAKYIKEKYSRVINEECNKSLEIQLKELNLTSTEILKETNQLYPVISGFWTKTLDEIMVTYIEGQKEIEVIVNNYIK